MPVSIKAFQFPWWSKSLPCGPLEASLPPFEQLVQAIGGRERILLVGELCESRQLMFQFVKALFPRPEEADKEPEPRRLLSPCPRVTELVNGSREQRRLRARLLLFLFRQEFLCSRRNEPLIRELLRDVRQRCCSWEPLPGLVGVVHTESDTQGEDLSAAVRFIEHQLRTVFHRHPSDCVQALPFVADRVDSVRELKKSSCDVLRASSGITSGAVPRYRVAHTPVLFCGRGVWGRRRRSGGRGGGICNTDYSDPLVEESFIF
uniref:Uncharacterized protein n=1 Tax=Callorhinchus milii TaxID=7868 RepID=A0A4W3IIG6_CALMI